MAKSRQIPQSKFIPPVFAKAVVSPIRRFPDATCSSCVCHPDCEGPPSTRRQILHPAQQSRKVLILYPIGPDPMDRNFFGENFRENNDLSNVMENDSYGRSSFVFIGHARLLGNRSYIKLPIRCTADGTIDHECPLVNHGRKFIMKLSHTRVPHPLRRKG
jgi:hypothetical protein